MRTLITVNRKDIAFGKKYFNDPDREQLCPVAMAISRMTKEVCVEVKRDSILVGNRRPRAMPRSVIRFIRRFDAKESVKPFKFYLDI